MNASSLLNIPQASETTATARKSILGSGLGASRSRWEVGHGCRFAALDDQSACSVEVVAARHESRA
jgi:hypothetical protein